MACTWSGKVQYLTHNEAQSRISCVTREVRFTWTPRRVINWPRLTREYYKCHGGSEGRNVSPSSPGSARILVPLTGV